MKNVMTLATAGLIALSAPAFAGTYGGSVVEEAIVQVEEGGGGSSGSIGSVGWAILGLALIAGIVVASDDSTN